MKIIHTVPLQQSNNNKKSIDTQKYWGKKCCDIKTAILTLVCNFSHNLQKKIIENR
jgi:hypothetical protein